MVLTDTELESFKKMLLSVLLSSKEGIVAHKLEDDYRELTCDDIPYRKFGFDSAKEFILRMVPDVATLSTSSSSSSTSLGSTPVGVRRHSLSECVSQHVTQLLQVRSAGLLHTNNILEQQNHLVRLMRMLGKRHEGQPGQCPNQLGEEVFLGIGNETTKKIEELVQLQE